MDIEAIVSALRSAIENNSAIEARNGEEVLFDSVKSVKTESDAVIIDFVEGHRAKINVSIIEADN